MWRRTVKSADAVTVEAKANALGAIANAVVIPPGIDGVQFAPGLGSLRVPGRVIGVGRLLARKGYDVLIRALGRTLQSHPEVHLLIVGDGPEKQVLKQLATRLGVDAAVTFFGRVPRSDLPSLLRTAEVFCHPASWDNVPFAPLEAMGCGLPTVVSASGGLPEIVGTAGVVHRVGDDAELSAILVQLLSNPSLRETLGKAARARVLERFTWEAMCDSYIELYDSLTAMRASRSTHA
jgi:glycosyltransferase involved in cell wall biosynthesis